MAVEGTLDLFRLPEILQVIAQQGKTGILTIQGTEDIVAVSFLQGRIVAADSLNATVEEGLGAVLVAEERLEAGTLQRLAARSDSEGVRLADLLVREGHIDRPGLLEALRRQTFELLLSLLDWRRGEFKFYGGDEVSYEEGFRPIAVDELLIRAIEEGTEEEPHPVPTLETRLRRVEGERPVRLRPAATLEGIPSAPESDTALWVTPEEQRVLDGVSPGRTVEEVARAAEVPPDRARYVLYRFAREGLVVPMAATAQRAPGAARTAPTPGGTAVAGAPGRPAATAVRPQPTEAATPARVRPPRPAEAARLRTRESEALAHYVAAGMALVAAVLAVVSLTVSPVASLLPFPWLDGERAALHDEEDSARFLELDVAAKTFFLLRGRFPDDLEELAALGMVAPEDLVDSRGRRLAYEPRERDYLLRTPAAGGGGRHAEEPFRESIAGNFLLDPDFHAGAPGTSGTEPPLVLLD